MPGGRAKQGNRGGRAFGEEKSTNLLIRKRGDSPKKGQRNQVNAAKSQRDRHHFEKKTTNRKKTSVFAYRKGNFRGKIHKEKDAPAHIVKTI